MVVCFGLSVCDSVAITQFCLELEVDDCEQCLMLCLLLCVAARWDHLNSSRLRTKRGAKKETALHDLELGAGHGVEALHFEGSIRGIEFCFNDPTIFVQAKKLPACFNFIRTPASTTWTAHARLSCPDRFRCVAGAATIASTTKSRQENHVAGLDFCAAHRTHVAALVGTSLAHCDVPARSEDYAARAVHAYNAGELLL